MSNISTSCHHCNRISVRCNMLIEDRYAEHPAVRCQLGTWRPLGQSASAADEPGIRDAKLLGVELLRVPLTPGAGQAARSMMIVDEPGSGENVAPVAHGFRSHA